MGGSLMWEGSGWSWYPPRPTPEQLAELERYQRYREQDEAEEGGQERADHGPGHEDEADKECS